jgi:hypothetical protein
MRPIAKFDYRWTESSNTPDPTKTTQTKYSGLLAYLPYPIQQNCQASTQHDYYFYPVKTLKYHTSTTPQNQQQGDDKTLDYNIQL